MLGLASAGELPVEVVHTVNGLVARGRNARPAAEELLVAPGVQRDDIPTRLVVDVDVMQLRFRSGSTALIVLERVCTMCRLLSLGTSC